MAADAPHKSRGGSAPLSRPDGFSGQLRRGEILALALAVVRPAGTALLLNPDNSRDRWVPLSEAVEGGRAFAVEVARDILAVEGDEPDSSVKAARLAQELRADGHHPVLVASGRPDHRHLFCRIGATSIRHRFTEHARALGLQIRGTIRPPGAPHRLGLPVALLEPVDPREARAALALPIRRPLSPRMAALLRDGDGAGRYRSRSELVLALALAAVNAGWAETDLYQALMDGGNAGGAKVREIVEQKGRAAAERYVSGRWTKAVARAAQRPAVGDKGAALAQIQSIREAAERTPWPARAGATEWSVLWSHLAIAESTGRVVHGASVRQVAELAGLNIATVSRARQRLVRADWLRRVGGPHKPTQADSWKLRCPAQRGTACATFPSPLRGGVRGNVAESAQSASDAWRWGGGLGKSALRVWLALAKAHTAEALAGGLGVSRRAVHWQLRRLAAVGLARQDDAGCWSRGNQNPETVAAWLGVAGTGERQRERHARERAAYQTALNWSPAKHPDPGAFTVGATALISEAIRLFGGRMLEGTEDLQRSPARLAQGLQACFACGGYSFWRSRHMAAICITCHPPAAPELVSRVIGTGN